MKIIKNYLCAHHKATFMAEPTKLSYNMKKNAQKVWNKAIEAR